ncbi:MAG: SLBB domain-containing protein, partial [Gammaproteobacteria bacterium]
MPIRISRYRNYQLIVCGLLGTIALAGLLQAAPAPTPEQIEAFKRLSPEQQQQLIQQYQSAGGGDIVEAPVSQPETVIDSDRRTGLMRGEQGNDRIGRASAPDGRRADADTGAYDVEAEADALLSSTVDKDPETGLDFFGYDVFSGVPTTFAPVTDVPVPTDYVLAPGDTIAVQLYGKETGSFTLAVNRDGAINFPQLGPIVVAGVTFDETRALLQARVGEQMIGTNISVTLGQLRSIRIFVLGEVNQPGSYTVSSLSTITNALLSSGGISQRGSLRTVQLKRSGNLITTLDLYDLLLRGDTQADVRLQPGDVIFVPPVGMRVAISGEVVRPAVYELKGETTAGDVALLAGGYSPTAYLAGGRVARVDAYRERIQIDVDLQTAAGQGTRLRAQDWVTVPSILDRVDNIVRLRGHVLRPGPRQYREGMRITDVISSVDDLRPMPDLDYVLIRRELPPDRRVVALSVDLSAALANPAGPENVAMMPRDQVHVFSIDGARPDLELLLEELRLQATLDQAAPLVSVEGRVRAPGTYPLETNMRVSDLLRAGGALGEAAYASNAEITRYEVVDGEYRQIGLVDVNLAAIRSGNDQADIELRPYDYLTVREVTDWREQETVTFSGEVRFPGTYPIRKGETLMMALERAGGLTPQAYAGGVVLTRDRLKTQEQQQIDQLASNLEADLAGLQLQAS